MHDSVVYPPSPEPVRLEIEPTNVCNGKCIFCPRSEMKREKGYMDLEKLRDFLERFMTYRETMWLNRGKRNKYPIMVLCGLGEPLLHPKIFDIIRMGRDYDFPVQLVTNGSTLSPKLGKKMIESDLNNLAISIHSLNPETYNKLTGLNLEDVLPRVESILEYLRGSGIELEIWRVAFPDGTILQDQEKFSNFLSRHKTVKVFGPTPAWNRGGLLADKFYPLANDGHIWCEKLYFTSSIAWDGRAVLCCCDYFNITVPLGNAWKDTIEDIQKRRELVFRSKIRPKICKACRRPIDNFYENEIYPKLA